MLLVIQVTVICKLAILFHSFCFKFTSTLHSSIDTFSYDFRSNSQYKILNIVHTSYIYFAHCNIIAYNIGSLHTLFSFRSVRYTENDNSIFSLDWTLNIQMVHKNYVILLIKYYEWDEFRILIHRYAPILVPLVLELYTRSHIFICVDKYN